jgi:hypothetical protein
VIYIFSPNIIKIVNSRRVSWEIHVACVRQKSDTAFISEKTEERVSLEDKDIVGREAYCQAHLKGMGWYSVIWALLSQNM